ncbi:helix-turn-helix domain-containing protein [Macrococcus sp. DPC7161]|uniref:helix-turn-helix domain-containing protein n=1 Tax=Macrococcus sp. DPC7161 TaxID=2507060 RepID=UPI001F0C45A5|nr:helix-turn-helix domain-containing protein [Macrococcus sp. DPC7161]
MNDLGQRIKSIRLSFGENMREFGERFNASDSLVSRWEKHGVIPTPERLKAIAELSNQSVDELLDVTDYKQLYEQQKQQINKLKKEILNLNSYIVGHGNGDEMAVMSQVLLVLENTIIDDWRDQE